MENLGTYTKSDKKKLFRKRFSSHDFSEYIQSFNKNNKICFPLKPKKNIKIKFFNSKSKLKISLPKLDDIKATFPKNNSSSKLLFINHNENPFYPKNIKGANHPSINYDYLLSQKDNKEINLPSINFPKLGQNHSILTQKRRKSISCLQPNKKFYLDQKIIRDYHATSLAGKKEYGETKTNQDSYLILTKINNLINYNIFAVFDGHGPEGHLVSQFLVEYFTDFFKNNSQLILCKEEPEVLNIFLKDDYKILKDAVKNCEEQLSKEDYINAQRSGSTMCMVIQIYKKIICMNVGDSRAIISLSEMFRDEIKNLSIDHKPNSKKELERIKKCGGFVEKKIYEDGIADGPFRVWSSPNLISPGLAISRSIGDLDCTSLGVISEPEFCLKSIKKEMNFIVIASDGICEYLDNKNVCQIVKNFYNNGNAKDAAEELVKKSREIWDKEGKEVDDITAIVVFL